MWRLPALGAARPYALAGVGVYQYSGRNETDPVHDADGAAFTVVYAAPDRVTSFAYGGGLGASVRAGSVSPFAEFRFMRMAGLQDRSVSSTRMPLTLGARLAF